MRSWLKYWREATVALGRIYVCHVSTPNRKPTKKKIFLSVGTGIIVGLKDGKNLVPWLLTARHVFKEPSHQWTPSSLVIRFSWMDEMPVEHTPGMTLALKESGKQKWHPHPDNTVDLACIPLPPEDPPPGRIVWPMVAFEEIGTTKDIYEGDPIVLLGYPDTIAPDFGARPIVRQGIVAWVSSKAPQSRLFCIDSHVYPGNSGGPVFRWSPQGDRSLRQKRKRPGGFLGIVTQARIHQLHLLAGGKEVEIHLQKKEAP